MIERNELPVKVVAPFLIACLLPSLLASYIKDLHENQIHVWYSLGDLTLNIFSFEESKCILNNLSLTILGWHWPSEIDSVTQR